MLGAATGDGALGLTPFLAGLAELAILLLALGYGAVRVRALLLPGWHGAPARLVEIVLGSAAVIWTSEVFGLFGWFSEWTMLLALVAVGVVSGVVSTRLKSGQQRESAIELPAPGGRVVPKVLAVVVCAALAAAWMIPTLGSLAAGMDRADTLWYHMPLAARFVQTGSLVAVNQFDPTYFAGFYPANSEIFHAVGILFTGRDALSPLVNDGWLIVALLACWCIGRPYGRGPEALIGGSVGLGAQMMVEFEAGEALNDIVGVAFLLAAAAILVNAHATGRRPRLAAIGMAGLATGIATGTKLSFLAAALALTVGAIAISPSGGRRRAAFAWIVPMFLAAGLWYVRNLIVVGNPIPEVTSLGPISLPAPVRFYVLRPTFSIFHYWSDPTVWREWFAPGLHLNLGLLWPVTVIGLIAIALAGILRGREPAMRVLAGVALFGAVAYVFTPVSAAGLEGRPVAFDWNVRYLAHSIALAFAILPCLFFIRSSKRGSALVLAGLFALVAFTIGSLDQWHQGHVKGALAAAVAVGLAGLALIWLREQRLGWSTLRTPARVAVATTAGLLAATGLYAEQRHYMLHRFENTLPYQELDGALRWARGVHESRIAVAGYRGLLAQYGFYGSDLSNYVQWLGRPTAHDGFARIPTCSAWRRALNRGNYQYVVTTFDPFSLADVQGTPAELLWTRSDLAAKVVLKQGLVHVFRITRPMNPAACEGLRRLTPHERNGSELPSATD